MDGNGTLGMSYSNTACGLNYMLIRMFPYFFLSLSSKHKL